MKTQVSIHMCYAAVVYMSKVKGVGGKHPSDALLAELHEALIKYMPGEYIGLHYDTSTANLVMACLHLSGAVAIADDWDKVITAALEAPDTP